MQVLHTADWHLGRTLYGRQRHAEFQAFLDWLVKTVETHEVETVLIAGDVFDTTTPGTRAQAQYYRFLSHMVRSRWCRHVVIIAGNHDSPSFLAAPQELLRGFDIHVVSTLARNADEEVITLRDQHGEAELIVCAVPYLRDHDIRQVEALETIADKEQKLLSGIRSHYRHVSEAAERQRNACPQPVPVIGMGHLFAAGGRTVEGDGVRDLYVGSLAHVTAGIFPKTLDYVALGHLHVPQPVGEDERIRYSGSPIAMGFGEARQQKSVCLLAVDGRSIRVSRIDVPRFRRLVQLEGDLETLRRKLDALRQDHSAELIQSDNPAWRPMADHVGRVTSAPCHELDAIWVELTYTGSQLVTDLNEQLHAAVQGSKLELLRIRNQRTVQHPVTAAPELVQTLDDLSPTDVFQRLLDREGIPEDQRPALLGTWRELLHRHDNTDPAADAGAHPRVNGGTV